MQGQRLNFPDLTGDVFLAAGLPRLAFKLALLGFQISDGFFQLFKIALGTIQEQFDLMAARMMA